MEWSDFEKSNQHLKLDFTHEVTPEQYSFSQSNWQKDDFVNHVVYIIINE
jgi:hypothetical protein